jgi:FkbM family methyltransferase
MTYILKYYDPMVKVYVGKRKLWMRLSQKTPLYHALYPIYASLPRIAASIMTINEELYLIEVGSNIGDTVSLITESISGASILCVEGVNEYYNFLKENMTDIKNNTIYMENKFCTDVVNNNHFSVDAKNGTAVLSKDREASISNIDTLDNIAEKYSLFEKVNFLKIVADGFEITILKSAKEILKRHPVIYLQFTPDLNIKNDQDPTELFELFVINGYKKGLFYSNFGYAIDIFYFDDKYKMQELINKIDNKEIYYYHILTVHSSEQSKYQMLFESEIRLV